jgi:hypothetical protein
MIRECRKTLAIAAAALAVSLFAAVAIAQEISTAAGH